MTAKGPWTLVLLFVFATASLSGQPAQAQLEETGTVKGLVCAQEYECWQGIPGATVTITRTDGVLPHEQSATAGDDGSFVFTEVPHGAYELTAARDGFEDGSANLSVDGDEYAQVPVEPKKVSVAVRVVDEDGNGLDADVWWYSDRDSGNLRVEDGSGTLDTLSGYHTLSVESPGFSRSEQWLLLDGSEVRVEMSPVPPQDAVVVGTVRDQDGAPVSGAVVQVHQYGHADRPEPRPLSASDGGSDEAEDPEATSPAREPYYPEGSNRTTTAADGSYRIHVWSGDVSLSVHKEGHAGRNAHFEVRSGAEHRHDVELPRYPEKTAHVEGKVVGVDGKPLRNVYVSIWLPEYGIRECSAPAQAGGGTSGSSGNSSAGKPEPAGDAIYYPYERSCAITMNADGTFSGDVTPGYAIVEAWHDHWSTCSESTSSDGSMTRSCGPEYLGYTRTLVLPADDTTQLTIQMKARPAADATISGYVVDGDSQSAIPGVRVEFSNEETYGWGSATTDGDGSYKVGVRGGHHRVSVYAEGYLPWQGMVEVPAGGDVSLDVVLTPGQAEHGYCCYAYDMAYAEEASADGEAVKARSDAPAMNAGAGDDDSGRADGEAVQDLGGGLGPYDPQRREQELQGADNGAPGPATVLLTLALLGAALVARRHR